MDLTIIIPTKDRDEILNTTLASVVEATKHIHAEVIVINDSKTSVPVVSSYHTNVQVKNNPKSGVASARNLGASLAKAELLLFVDDDMIVTKENIDAIVESNASNSYYITIANWIYPPELQQQLRNTQFGRYFLKYNFHTLQGWMGNVWDPEKLIFETPSGASCFLPIQKCLFRKVGGYNESFPHAGAEDYEFFQRLKKLGARFFVNKSITVYHNEKDRIVMNNWLNRKKRNGETFRIASDLGHRELSFSYSPIKKAFFKAVLMSRPAFFFIMTILPNHRVLDRIYFSLINILLGAYIYEGYSHAQA